MIRMEALSQWNTREVTWGAVTLDCYGRQILIEDISKGIDPEIVDTDAKPFENVDFITLSKEDAKNIIDVCKQAAEELIGKDDPELSEVFANRPIAIFGEEAANSFDHLVDAYTGKRYWITSDDIEDDERYLPLLKVDDEDYEDLDDFEDDE